MTAKGKKGRKSSIALSRHEKKRDAGPLAEKKNKKGCRYSLVQETRKRRKMNRAGKKGGDELDVPFVMFSENSKKLRFHAGNRGGKGKKKKKKRTPAGDEHLAAVKKKKGKKTERGLSPQDLGVKKGKE